MTRADLILEALRALIEARRDGLDDPELSGLVIEIRLQRQTGEVRQATISPKYEAWMPLPAPHR